MSLYRFLADHSVGPFYFQAGTTASTADDGVGLLPVGWVPTGGVEPLDSSAVAAFFAAGPQFGWPIRQQWTGIGVPRPVTYWVPDPMLRLAIPIASMSLSASAQDWASPSTALTALRWARNIPRGEMRWS